MADADMESMVLDVERRMEGAVEALQREYSGLRTGRASVGLLEPIMVEAYGTATIAGYPDIVCRFQGEIGPSGFLPGATYSCGTYGGLPGGEMITYGMFAK